MGKKITIIGGGNGAFTAASDLTLAGNEVTLYEDERFKSNIEEILKSRKITLKGVGRTGDAVLAGVTTDLGEALKDADIVMPVMPAYALKNFALKMVDHLKPGMKIILTPGSTGGALIVSKIWNDKGVLSGVRLAEMHTLPYACRKVDPSTVNILLECKKMYFASFPAIYNEEMYALISGLYPAVELVSNVLESSLNNGNPVSHPAPVVLNAGKIEYFKGEHYHYREGITPSVARVNEAIDKERQAICAKFGFPLVDAKERLHLMGYAPKRDSLYECYRDSAAFNPLKGPKDLNDRYLTEDTPCSLVALSSIASSIGIDTPVMDSIITIASTLKDEDYWSTGITVEDLGLKGKNVKQIMDFLQTGY